MESTPAIRLIRHTALYALILLCVPAHGQGTLADTVGWTGGCTCVVIHRDGWALTAEHCGHRDQFEVEIAGRTVTAQRVFEPEKNGTDEAVLIKLDGGPFAWAPVASQPARVGDPVKSWGFPAGKLTFVSGRVTQVQRNGEVFTDTALHGGHSGGPLFNAQDEVCGLASTSDRSSLATWIGLPAIERATSTASMAPVEKPRLYLFVTDNCAPCNAAKADEAELRRYYDLQILNVNTPEGREAFDKLRTYRNRQGAGVRFENTRRQLTQPAFPCFWVQGSGTALVGYPGVGALRTFIGAVLRLPLTLAELILGRLDPERGGDPGPIVPVPDPGLGSVPDPGFGQDVTPFEAEPDFEGVTIIAATHGLRTNPVQAELAVFAAEKVVNRVVARVSQGKAEFHLVSSLLRPTAYTDLQMALPLTKFGKLNVIVLVPRTSQGLIRGLVIKKVESAIAEKLPEVTASVSVVFERDAAESYMGALRAVSVEEREPEPPDAREGPDTVEQPDAHEHEAEVSGPVGEASVSLSIRDLITGGLGSVFTIQNLWLLWRRLRRKEPVLPREMPT